jgi:septin family protein
LIVIGAAGSGKATLLSSIYQQEVLPSERRRYARTIDGIEFADYSAEVQEAGITLRLNVTEVLGYGELSFGGSKKNAEKVSKILKHIEGKHRNFFDRENFAQRPNTAQVQAQKSHQDGLYHAAIFIVKPQKNLALSAGDIALLQTLQPRVNLIPVVAKADTYLPEELARIKVNLRIALSQAKVLQFPNIIDTDEVEWVVKEAVEVRAHCPFVTVASAPSAEHQNARFRQYPWGVVPVEAPLRTNQSARTGLSASLNNLSMSASSVSRLLEHAAESSHNDLTFLQKMLIRSHFEFLKRHTVEKLYEIFRTEMVCHVQEAPQAPLRLVRSREEIRSKIEEVQKAVEAAQVDVNVLPEEELLESSQEWKVSASLDPIHEEDEFSSSCDNLAGPERKKKRIVMRLKKSTSLTGLKDSDESPRPILQ